MKRSIVIVFLLMSLSSYTHAGFNGLTHHSRANCGFNESISWDATKKWNLWVFSVHRDIRTGGTRHQQGTGWQYTWRCAVAHFNEGNDYLVYGEHWMPGKYGPELVAYETVSDCRWYDGWWDV